MRLRKTQCREAEEHLCRGRAPGGGNEIFRGRRIDIFAVCDTDHVGRVCRSKWTNFQTWAAQKIEALLNQSHTPTELDGCDEAHSTVVLFRNWWPAFQRREQVGEPAVVFGIVGAGIGDKWFIGDLLQTDFASPCERMRGMRGQPDTVTAKFLEHDSGQDFWWHLNQQGDVQLAVAQSAQHFPGGHVVKLNAYAGILFVKKTQ